MCKKKHAYLAGIIDGEGHIYICRAKDSKSGKRYYTMGLDISSTDERLPLWIKENYGGNYYLKKDKGVRTGNYWRWCIQSNKAVKVLQDVFPYLVIKREQALIAIEFQLYKNKKKKEFLKNMKRTRDERGRIIGCWGTMEQSCFDNYYKNLRALHNSIGTLANSVNSANTEMSTPSQAGKVVNLSGRV